MFAQRGSCAGKSMRIIYSLVKNNPFVELTFNFLASIRSVSKVTFFSFMTRKYVISEWLETIATKIWKCSSYILISFRIANVKFLSKIINERINNDTLHSFSDEVYFRVHSWYVDLIFEAGKADVFNSFIISPLSFPDWRITLTRIRKRSATSSLLRGHVISGKGQRSRKSKGRQGARRSGTLLIYFSRLAERSCFYDFAFGMIVIIQYFLQNKNII